MSGVVLPNGRNYFEATGGGPAVGYKLYTYVPNSSTLKDTYTTALGNVANQNPVVMDSRGEAAIYWVGDYDVTLKTDVDVTVWGPERLNQPETAGTAAIILTDLADFADAAKGDALIGVRSTLSGGFARTQHAKNADVVSVKDFGAVGDDSADDTAAVGAAIAAAAASSGTVYFPSGIYKVSSQIAQSNFNGLVLQGAGASLETTAVRYAQNTVLRFDSLSAGVDAMIFSDFVGLTIRDMVISHNRGGSGGGKTLYLHTAHDYVIENVKVETKTGNTGKSIVLGGGSGVTSAFLGSLRNIKVFGDGGTSIESNSNTTLTFLNCYQVGGRFSFNATVYSTLISCASELSPTYGYTFSGGSNISIISCGGEDNAKGVFYLSTTATNYVLSAPYGASNNTSADATIGDLVYIDSAGGACNSITIDNPTSVSPNAATVQSIYANAGNGFVEVRNVDATLLPKGINGNGTWVATKLSVTGTGEVRDWTPALVNWTNVGSPTLVGKYTLKGNLVHFYCIITPGTSISSTKGTSQITGLPFTTPPGAIAMMVDGNANSYGACAMSTITGAIFPQTSGVLTVPITISGTFLQG
jgi:hypothetical protein